MLSQHFFSNLRRALTQLEHSLGTSESDFVSHIHKRLSAQRASFLDNSLLVGNRQNLHRKQQSDDISRIAHQQQRHQEHHSNHYSSPYPLTSHHQPFSSSSTSSSSLAIPQLCEPSQSNFSTHSQLPYISSVEEDNCDIFSQDVFSFQRPRDSYISQILASLLSPEVVSNKVNKDTALSQSIQTLLSTVELIQSGLECRSQSEDSSLGYRKENFRSPSSMLKGNFYLYSVPFNLIRLQHGAINDLLSGALQEKISVQYWIEREAKLNFAPENCISFLSEHPQHLTSAWNLVLHSRDTLLPDSTARAISHLFGRDSVSALSHAGQLGCNLAKIFTFIDDLSFFADRQATPAVGGGRRVLSEHSCLRFFLRLPVVLFLAQNAGQFQAKNDIQTVIVQIDDIIRNGRSDCVGKTAAMIEAYSARVSEQIVNSSPPVNADKRCLTTQAVLQLLNVCTNLQDFIEQ